MLVGLYILSFVMLFSVNKDFAQVGLLTTPEHILRADCRRSEGTIFFLTQRCGYTGKLSFLMLDKTVKISEDITRGSDRSLWEMINGKRCQKTNQ